jgi:hypothetical protein
LEKGRALSFIQVPVNKQLIPDLTLINTSPDDPDEILRERARAALPRIIADLGRQAGEAAWRDTPVSLEMPESDKARLVRETAEAYQRNLTQRQMNEIADDVYRRLKARRDGARTPDAR